MRMPTKSAVADALRLAAQRLEDEWDAPDDPSEYEGQTAAEVLEALAPWLLAEMYLSGYERGHDDGERGKTASVARQVPVPRLQATMEL